MFNASVQILCLGFQVLLAGVMVGQFLAGVSVWALLFALLHLLTAAVIWCACSPWRRVKTP